jgi:protein SCO1/2
VFAAKAPNGNVDRTLPHIDRRSTRVLRVQYLGVRFDPEEFRRDLLSLLQE